ncbi:restriction endonuclease subunit S [Nonomuraea aridisoli]|uniref:Restriction endonuclease subunit S n=2 Tax=Nonomuraea aridisoli TaxID=2070368 RepID=A0A2W2F4B6_9ACTN|nr:restriction endonuclease subunit S [Nonomuraea aridisoli]
MSAAARAGNDKVPFLRTSNVLWDRLDLSSLDEMSIPARELPEKLVELGDLLVCEGGEIGRAAIWDGSVTPMAFQNHLHRLRPKSDDVDPRFYVFFLHSAFTQLGIFEGAGNKTTIPNLSSSRLAALEVPHPSLPEQQAIVGVLGKIREAEVLHGELRAGAIELKRAAMEQVFRRGLLSEDQVDSLLGLIPEGWVVEELGDSHTVQTGGTPSRRNSRYWEGGTIPWVKTAEVSYSTITETSEHITATALEETNVKLFPAGTLLLAMYGQGVTRGKVGKLGIKATCNQACAAIQCPGGIVDPDYLYYFLEWQYENIRARAHGGQQQNLSLDIVRKIPIAYPRDLSQQQEIATLFRSIDQKIELHQARLDRLRELYQRVLLDIMTGEVSADDLVPPARTSEGSAA